MRVLAACLLVLAISTSIAVAGANYGCGLFIDFTGTAEDWDDVLAGDNAIYPQIGESFDVYVGLVYDRVVLVWNGQGYEWESGGDLEVHSVTFGLEFDALTAQYVSMESLLPSGDVFTFPDHNYLVYTWGCEVAPVVYVARFTFYFTYAPGDIFLVEHSNYGREVADCTPPDGLVDEYCIANSAGIGQLPTGGEAGCDPFYDNPVEFRTWGSIKALYRSGR